MEREQNEQGIKKHVAFIIIASCVLYYMSKHPFYVFMYWIGVWVCVCVSALHSISLPDEYLSLIQSKHIAE